MIILIVVLTTLSLLLLVSGAAALHAKKSAPSLTAGLSKPGKQLVREYNSLPAEHRPFPDIIELVKSLDEITKMYADERDRQHFNESYLPMIQVYQGFEFRWRARGALNCTHRKGTCKFAEYYSLHKAIEEVKISIDKKERAMLESRHAADTAMVAELETRLRQEAQLNDHFVKEFKELE